jgi:hypothetical protein
MAADIVQLKNSPRKHVVQALEEALEKAKTGALTNVVIAGWRDDDFLECWSAGWNRDNISAVAALQHKVLQTFMGR